MAELSEREKAAFHEFSVRYRAAYAKLHPTPQESIDKIREAIWGEYDKQMERERNSGVGPPEPTQEKSNDQEREPEDPER